MNGYDPRGTVSTVLGRAATQLGGTDLPAGLALELERLARQVEQPCVVAIVGRVNAGKSTFVNALLGEDLAAVGITETTAVVSYFSFDPTLGKSVFCHWRDGRVTEEDAAFCDSLQGNDLETLRRADEIEYLEYFLPNDLLEQITLVDTPGTGSVVGEHRERTAEFMRLSEEWSTRRDKETVRLGSEADAVIYLVGSKASATDRTFLEEFSEATNRGQARALNAFGVLSKIDMDPDGVAKRHVRANKIAEQFEDSLNTVVPVSAGLHRAVDGLLADNQAGLERLSDALQSIPPATLGFLLDDERFFCEADPADCPVPSSERRILRGDADWGVFATIARVLADPGLSPDAAVAHLQDISGFDLLKKVLNQHFLERGRILRCYRIINDARKELEEAWYTHVVPDRRRRTRQNREVLNRFLAFIRRQEGDPDTASELEDFVRRHLETSSGPSELEKLWRELERELVELSYRLMEDNADFEALQQIVAGGDCASEFSSEELSELRALLGMYGGEIAKRLPPTRTNDVEYVGDRQLHWHRLRIDAPNGSCQQYVSERAYNRYGLILDLMLTGSSQGEDLRGAPTL